MSLMSKLRFEDAEDLLLRALSIDFQKPVEAQKKILHTRYLNLGLLYTLMRRFNNARETIKLAEGYVISNFGKDSYYIATCERTLGNIDYQEESLDQARTRFERAYTILTGIYEIHPTISATTYMLGCVALMEGKVDESVQWLRQSLYIAEFDAAAKGDGGEVARVSRKLAAALYKQKHSEEAEQLHKSAEEARKQFQGALYSDLPDTDSSYDLLVAAQYR